MPKTPFAATNSWCYHFARYEVLPEVIGSSEASSGQPFRLVDIVKRVMNDHLTEAEQHAKYARRDSGEQLSVSATVKWYVPFIAKNTQQLIRLGGGMFRVPSVSDVADDADDAEEAATVLAGMPEQLEGKEEEEEEEEESSADFGGLIYAFTFESLERDFGPFPLKIGMTVKDAAGRMISQCRSSAAFDRPKLLHTWEVKRVRAVESAIHQVLKARGLWRSQAYGMEWFDTRVEDVDKILKFVTET